MDIKRALAQLNFMDTGQQPAPDCSTYATMVATWRHPTKAPPTEAELLAAWDVIVALPPEVDPDAALQADLADVDPLIAAVADADTRAALVALSDAMKGKGQKGGAVKGRKPAA